MNCCLFSWREITACGISHRALSRVAARGAASATRLSSVEQSTPRIAALRLIGVRDEIISIYGLLDIGRRGGSASPLAGPAPSLDAVPLHLDHRQTHRRQGLLIQVVGALCGLCPLLLRPGIVAGNVQHLGPLEN